MINLPWSRKGETHPSEDSQTDHEDAMVVCEFQDGTLAVYADRVVIERVSRSNFEDRTIPTTEITGVDFDSGITIGYIQIEQVNVPVDSGGLLSDPVNPNTVHFDRSGRKCARKARDAILEHAQG